MIIHSIWLGNAGMRAWLRTKGKCGEKDVIHRNSLRGRSFDVDVAWQSLIALQKQVM